MDISTLNALQTRWQAMIRTCLCGLIFLFPASLSAQPEDAGQGRESAEGQQEIEEIIVNAPADLKKLRTEIDRARDAMFTVFNDFNDDDRFDIHCKYVRRWQSKIRQQVCQPQYMETALEEEAELTLKYLGYVGAEQTGPGIQSVDRDNAILKEKMTEIFMEHPEFSNSVNEFNALTEYYEDQRKAVFGKE